MGQIRRDWGKHQRPSALGRVDRCQEQGPHLGNPGPKAGSGDQALGEVSWIASGLKQELPASPRGQSPGILDTEPCSWQVSAHPCLSFPTCTWARAVPSRYTVSVLCQTMDSISGSEPEVLVLSLLGPAHPKCTLWRAHPSGPSSCSPSTLSRCKVPAE